MFNQSLHESNLIISLLGYITRFILVSYELAVRYIKVVSCKENKILYSGIKKIHAFIFENVRIIIFFRKYAPLLILSI